MSAAYIDDVARAHLENQSDRIRNIETRLSVFAEAAVALEARLTKLEVPMRAIAWMMGALLVGVGGILSTLIVQAIANHVK